MQRIDGKALAAKIRVELAKEIISSSLHPKLAVLLVGNDAPSHLYVNLKEKAAHEVGITTDIRRLPATITDRELIEIITSWNADPSIHGILVQLPLPDGHATDMIVAAINPAKDADGFHPENVRKLLAGEGTIIPPIHEGILRLISETDVPLNRTPTIVIANSETFAAPLVYLFKIAGACITKVSPDSFDPDTVRDAKIIVIAVGRPAFLTCDLVTSGDVIIDVGTNKTPDGHVVGDADIKHLIDIPGWISPVPGGVGPMTIAMLLKSVVTLAKHAT